MHKLIIAYIPLDQGQVMNSSQIIRCTDSNTAE